MVVISDKHILAATSTLLWQALVSMPQAYSAGGAAFTGLQLPVE